MENNHYLIPGDVYLKRDSSVQHHVVDSGFYDLYQLAFYNNKWVLVSTDDIINNDTRFNPIIVSVDTLLHEYIRLGDWLMDKEYMGYLLYTPDISCKGGVHPYIALYHDKNRLLVFSKQTITFSLLNYSLFKKFFVKKSIDTSFRDVKVLMRTMGKSGNVSFK